MNKDEKTNSILSTRFEWSKCGYFVRWRKSIFFFFFYIRSTVSHSYRSKLPPINFRLKISLCFSNLIMQNVSHRYGKHFYSVSLSRGIVVIFLKYWQESVWLSKYCGNARPESHKNQLQLVIIIRFCQFLFTYSSIIESFEKCFYSIKNYDNFLFSDIIILFIKTVWFINS